MAAARQETQVALSFRDRLKARLLAGLGWFVVQVIGRTSRLTSHRPPAVQELIRDRRPFIYAFWHRYQLLMVWEHRNCGVSVLVSRSRDGELIARVLQGFGFKTVRGSSSRGGATAFRELLDVVEGGGRVAFTPDGPKGPSGSIQPGVLALAVRTGVPIVPVAWAGTRVCALSSWDRFLIPLPFGRYTVVFGEPLRIPREDDAARDRLRDALNAAEAEAARRLREKTPC